ncbi:hypothetical protein BJK06_11175 [Curtobacterium sp. BH-2-1-1]|uniref:quinone oxidoreductase family protein n=1 Tax=Curtobacterium sp. BH-2-1-1 TaxID=1905847 RepID=UPI00089DDA0C|nr:zinc-binding dehydrogenase [Curtobacterium sp. BH-2-1-1]AOX66241.1 hypothetical protein BJK06_11175 [Curtobacterium sp. BH-2-1-1]
MRVIGLERFGGPEVLESIELPDPRPASGEVRVRVRAAAVNPVDTIIRSGHFAGNDDLDAGPVVPGTDIVGTIDEIGPDQPAGTDFTVGDDVIAFVAPHGAHGGYSELVTVPALSAARRPATMAVEHAASFLSNALTAAVALEALALRPGDTLAVTGATGAVGGYLVELAARQRVTVVAAAAADEVDLVRGFGAAHVLHRDGDFVDGVLAFTDGRGVDALADPAVLTDRVVGAVRDGGQIAFFLPNDSHPGRGITVFRSYVMHSTARHDLITELVELAASGAITTRVAGVVPAAEAASAHARHEQGGTRGRFILAF